MIKEWMEIPNKLFNTRDQWGALSYTVRDVYNTIFGNKGVLVWESPEIGPEFLSDSQEFIGMPRAYKNKGKSYEGHMLSNELRLVIYHAADEEHPWMEIMAHTDYLRYPEYAKKVDEFIERLKKMYTGRSEKPAMKVIVPTEGGLTTRDVDLDSNKKLELNKYYNEDFGEVHQTILDRLNTPKDKGLVLLHGVPGTGKSSYLRQLSGIITKKPFIFLPNSLAAKLASPDILSLFLKHKDSILIIEDAEDLLIDRGNNYNKEGVSNLLNVADGLLSDVLNIQVICTFNCSLDQVDKALLRKGRLIAKYEFKPLAVDRANNLLKELKHDYKTNEPMPLTDIFNFEEKKYANTERPKIGFR